MVRSFVNQFRQFFFGVWLTAFLKWFHEETKILQAALNSRDECITSFSNMVLELDFLYMNEWNGYRYFLGPYFHLLCVLNTKTTGSLVTMFNHQSFAFARKSDQLSNNFVIVLNYSVCEYITISDTHEIARFTDLFWNVFSWKFH